MHTCQSFMQSKDDAFGVCENRQLCAPIKSALNGERCIVPNLGQVVCPYQSINVARVSKDKAMSEAICREHPDGKDELQMK